MKLLKIYLLINTLIVNKYGCKNVGYVVMVNHKKKKYTSLTTVINDNNKPVIIFDNKTNNKIINTNTIKHYHMIVYYNQ